MRLIDAERLKMNIESAIINNPVFGNKLKELAKMLVLFGIDNAPTIDLLKHGEWQHKKDCPLNYFECSLCGNEHVATFDHNDNFCSNCGAKMDGEVNEP